MNQLVRYIKFTGEDKALESNKLIYNEWLLTNALGGYSSLSIGGATTRKYHGLLVAALPSPLGRIVMLSTLFDSVYLADGLEHRLSAQEISYDENFFWEKMPSLKEFLLVDGLPTWIYQIQEVVIEKKVVLLHQQNTVHVTYKLLQSNSSVILKCKPLLNFRHHESSLKKKPEACELLAANNHFELTCKDFPSLKFMNTNQAKFIHDTKTIEDIFYRLEAERGYDSLGALLTPGYFEIELKEGEETSFIFSTEKWEVIQAMSPQDSYHAEKIRRKRLLRKAEAVNPKINQSMLAQELVLAADQFIFIPITRLGDIAYGNAFGDQAKSIIAGYHWFTDWGRDTMISLEGLTLTTGRVEEAGCILRTFAHYVKHGLIPNMFPEGEKEAIYYTADASLWFFHALDRYLVHSNDQETLKFILPYLIEITNAHLRGTLYGIQVDPTDGLLAQGELGYALTWMDAKVGDLVVTPRRGKAVEINALWYNALCLLSEWLEQLNEVEAAKRLREHAIACYKSFNEKFWYQDGGYLYDVIEGDIKDSSCRPNQILAFSLKYPILDPSKWKAVLHVVEEKLLTPFGLRSLSPEHSNYKVNYEGDLFTRDSAYHQGTVWSWLIGPYIDAWLRVYPEDLQKTRAFLLNFEDHILHSCVGSVSEIFDAEKPYRPRGCIAQAWSVAEILRCWQKTEG